MILSSAHLTQLNQSQGKVLAKRPSALLPLSELVAPLCVLTLMIMTKKGELANELYHESIVVYC